MRPIRSGTDLRIEAGMFYVTHHADHLAGHVDVLHVNSDALSDRVFIRPKFPGHGLANHNVVADFSSFAVVESSSTQQRNSQSLKEMRLDDGYIDLGLFGGGKRRTTFYLNACAG